MGKLERLRMNGLGNAAESMGAGVPGRTAPGSALHGATAVSAAALPAQLQGVSRNKDAAHIPTDKIGSDPAQPREEFEEDELAKLAESLRTRGQLQPITVYWDEKRGIYVLVCGERRWRAAKLAEIPTMTATILARVPEAGERLALQCIENLLRSDLRPVEEAKAYRQLMSLNGWSAAQLSRELAVSESKVTRGHRRSWNSPSRYNPRWSRESCPQQRPTKSRRSKTGTNRPNSPSRWSARSSRGRTRPGSFASGSRPEQGTRRSPSGHRSGSNS